MFKIHREDVIDLNRGWMEGDVWKFRVFDSLNVIRVKQFPQQVWWNYEEAGLVWELELVDFQISRGYTVCQ